MKESDDNIAETKKLTEEYLRSNWMADYRYFLVEENAEVVGGCGITTFRIPPQAAQVTGVYAYLSNMYIEPSYRRKGYGHALLRYIISVCKRERIGLLLLHASQEGHPLYESVGFSNAKSLMHLITPKSVTRD